MTPPGDGSSILFQNKSGSVVLLDLPRSIEESQVVRGERPTWRLVSSEPPIHPFPTPEPKNPDGIRSAQSRSAQIAELMTIGIVTDALSELEKHYKGPFCLPRVTALNVRPGRETDPLRDCKGSQEAETPVTPTSHNPEREHSRPPQHHRPPNSHALNGPIESLIPTLRAASPAGGFDLILMDPPWPNRSAKRKRRGRGRVGGAYGTVASLDEVRTLLAQIPVPQCLRLPPSDCDGPVSGWHGGGLVAIWVTNRPGAAELLSDPSTGLLAAWGIEVVAEWTWVKVTAGGEPVFPLESAWRKPWERLLIAGWRGQGRGRRGLGPKVIVSVPDVHSRKPSLRGLIADIFGRDDFVGLEVFARHLTAGWWSMGDEVLKFQSDEYWVDENRDEREA